MSSDDKITPANLKIDLQELSLEDDMNTKTVPTSTPSSPTTRKPSTATKMNCLCAPTNHPGSFRCRQHRASGLGNRRTVSVGANLHQLSNTTPTTQRSREC
ncbi:hypothetical protein L1987_49403 [Smallanthus sonchifolius]|uniref:Uncharacterized protein n=1 Tax=Smallanthus sonchifolius TaxID=185202 RepID=A0ACB9FVK0_9ASTR|nr:hypothetical protein L1987_49403 [Smallanthus sonchifolius]